ncbi:phBC6A51 family helix-turn-helix protein [Paenibacillus sp. GD4]|uniref:phBC6A51 family helix-turn-helix protein n=1 Tax=Paenibacillus sp. GD4 TaxID=3068890 RepID=UPI0027968B4C|nr:phBC6A51 family helix-turn-helix protein [Paenibacillus sp. GD4]MDQ1913288.1 phBC6A51 family helix-turn-helix protein [Paenibacillus sp. GD4]
MSDRHDVDKREYMDGLNEIEIRAVELLANKGRRTYRELATDLGLSERHFRRIRDKKEVRYAVRERTLELMSDELPDVLGALAKSAKRGNVKAIEMYLAMQGINVNKSEVVQTVRDERPDNRSNEEIQKEIAELERMLNEIGEESNVVPIRKAK